MFKNNVSSRYNVVASQMNWSEYIDKLDNEGGYDDIIDEMHRSGGYDDDKMMDFTEESAKGEGITLMSPDNAAADQLHVIYKTTEKGLS